MGQDGIDHTPGDQLEDRKKQKTESKLGLNKRRFLGPTGLGLPAVPYRGRPTR